MTDLATIQKMNEDLARKVNKEALANSNSPYAGKYVGLANGQVVAIADSLRAVDRALDDVEPDRARTMTLEASVDYDRVQYIWINKFNP
jgi:hypothetical protein